MTTPSMAFLLLAENALTSGGHDPSVPTTLQELVDAVSAILSLDNLMSRQCSLLSVAMDSDRGKHQRDVNATLKDIIERGHVSEDDYYDVAASMANHGIHIGLVAGYLIARMLDGKDGEQ